MVLLQPLFEQNDTTDQSARIVRLMLRDLCNERPGPIQESAFQVVPRGAGSNQSVDILTGGLIIPATEGTGEQGYYYCVNDATTNFPVTAADPTDPRIDTIYVTVRDDDHSGVDNDAIFGVEEGTPASSPDPPTVTAPNHWKLADLFRAANDNVINTGDITDLRNSPTISPAQGRASAVGAPITCTSASRPATPREGQFIYEEDTGTIQVWNGTAWKIAGSTGSWNAYTPTVGGFSSQPSTKNGRWTRLGNIVLVQGGFTAPSSSNDVISVSLPVTCFDPGTDVRYLAGGRGYDGSVDARWASIGRIDPVGDPDNVSNFGTAGTGSWGTTIPFTWATGDLFRFFTAYEVE